jgi:hypothetical protein
MDLARRTWIDRRRIRRRQPLLGIPGGIAGGGDGLSGDAQSVSHALDRTGTSTTPTAGDDIGRPDADLPEGQAFRARKVSEW